MNGAKDASFLLEQNEPLPAAHELAEIVHLLHEGAVKQLLQQCGGLLFQMP